MSVKNTYPRGPILFTHAVTPTSSIMSLTPLLNSFPRSVMCLCASFVITSVRQASPADMERGLAQYVPPCEVRPMGRSDSMISFFPPKAASGRPPPIALARVIMSGSIL